MFKLLASCALLLLIITYLAEPAYAGQGDIAIQIAISPVAGEAGTIITINGSGAEPGLAVRVVLAAQPAPASDVFETVEFSPNADGTFAVSLTVPPGTPDGTYYVRAEQTKAGGTIPFYYYNRFQVGSTIDSALLPTTGQSVSTPYALMLGITLPLLLIMVAGGLHTVVWGRPERGSRSEAE